MAFKPLLLPDPFVFPAYPPGLPPRGVDDLAGPEYITEASVREEHQRGLTMTGTTQTGSVLRVGVGIVAPGIVRVLLEGEYSDPQRIMLARDLSDQAVAMSLERSGNRVTLVSDQVSVRIDLDPFQISFCGPDGRVILNQNYTHRDATGRITMLPFGFSVVEGQRVAFHDTFTAEPDEHFYGFGEKFTDLDKRGQRLEMWQHNTYGVHSERAYKNVPFFISTRGYGVFVDSAACVRFDMAASNNAAFSLVVPESALDYYVITGPAPKTIIQRYGSLVGLPTLPPKWAFGLWVSSGCQPDNTDRVLSRARLLREHNISCDVLHLDKWQRNHTKSDLQWDAEAFPDPENMIKQLKAKGYKVSVWMNPYLSVESERFPQASEKGYLLKTPDAEPYVLDLWDGDHPMVGIIDFSNPEAVTWYKGLLLSLLRQGVDVFKTDFGESVPSDAVANDGTTGEILHNLYPLQYNDVVSETTADESGRAGLVWARSSYAGGQRHTAQWAGDPDCTYQGMASTLRGGLSIGMCGHAFWSHDIGGFYVQPTPELYVRWAQFGLLSPLSRAHGVTTRLPWDYGEDATRIFRDYVSLRYRILPYLYTYGVVAAETNVPIMRAMVLEFPDDPNTYTLDLQFMLGSELLVAPIYNSEGRRPVYLPAGQWVDFWTHEVLEGPRTCWLDVPLDVLPLYVRANALIPTIEPPEYLSEEPFGLVTFDGYLFEKGSFRLRDSDGPTLISASLEGRELNVRVEGVKRSLGLRLVPLVGAPSVEAVRVDGIVQATVSALEISPESSAGWVRDSSGTVRVMIHRR